MAKEKTEWSDLFKGGNPVTITINNEDRLLSLEFKEKRMAFGALILMVLLNKGLTISETQAILDEAKANLMEVKF